MGYIRFHEARRLWGSFGDSLVGAEIYRRRAEVTVEDLESFIATEVRNPGCDEAHLNREELRVWVKDYQPIVPGYNFKPSLRIWLGHDTFRDLYFWRWSAFSGYFCLPGRLGVIIRAVGHVACVRLGRWILC